MLRATGVRRAPWHTAVQCRRMAASSGNAGPWLTGKVKDVKATAFGVLASIRRMGLETYTVGHIYWSGGARTRGQYQLIERNNKDLLQLLPFTVVAVMPGGFFILPIVVKLFPNFVPSVFRGKNYKSEKVLVLTQVRRKLSGDMQKCLVHVAETLRDKHGLEAGRALERITDEVFASSSSLRFIENIAILPVAQELSGQITLGDVGPGLTKMTEYFGCAAWTDWHVILQSATPACKCGFGGNRTYAEEGLGSLSKEELVESCSQRGLRVVNMDREELIEQLREWHVASACAPDSPATLCCVAVLMFHRNLAVSDHRYEEVPGCE